MVTTSPVLNQPSGVNDLARLLLAVPVAREHLRALDQQLTGRAERHRLARVVDDQDVGGGHGCADGAVAARRIEGDAGRSFSEPIGFGDGRAACLHPLRGDGRLDRGAGADDQVAAGEVELRESRARSPWR